MIAKPTKLINNMRKLAAKLDEYGKKDRRLKFFKRKFQFSTPTQSSTREYKAREWFDAANALREAADKTGTT